MGYEEVQILEEKTKLMHHDLANALISLRIVMEKFDEWPPEKKARHEAQWKSAYVNALDNLSVCLALVDEP